MMMIRFILLLAAAVGATVVAATCGDCQAGMSCQPVGTDGEQRCQINHNLAKQLDMNLVPCRPLNVSDGVFGPGINNYTKAQLGGVDCVCPFGSRRVPGRDGKPALCRLQHTCGDAGFGSHTHPLVQCPTGSYALRDNVCGGDAGVVDDPNQVLPCSPTSCCVATDLKHFPNAELSVQLSITRKHCGKSCDREFLISGGWAAVLLAVRDMHQNVAGMPSTVDELKAHWISAVRDPRSPDDASVITGLSVTYTPTEGVAMLSLASYRGRVHLARRFQALADSLNLDDVFTPDMFRLHNQIRVQSGQPAVDAQTSWATSYLTSVVMRITIPEPSTEDAVRLLMKQFVDILLPQKLRLAYSLSMTDATSSDAMNGVDNYIDLAADPAVHHANEDKTVFDVQLLWKAKSALDQYVWTRTLEHPLINNILTNVFRQNTKVKGTAVIVAGSVQSAFGAFPDPKWCRRVMHRDASTAVWPIPPGEAAPATFVPQTCGDCLTSYVEDIDSKLWRGQRTCVPTRMDSARQKLVVQFENRWETDITIYNSFSGVDVGAKAVDATRWFQTTPSDLRWAGIIIRSLAKTGIEAFIDWPATNDAAEQNVLLTPLLSGPSDRPVGFVHYQRIHVIVIDNGMFNDRYLKNLQPGVSGAMQLFTTGARRLGTTTSDECTSIIHCLNPKSARVGVPRYSVFATVRTLEETVANHFTLGMNPYADGSKLSTSKIRLQRADVIDGVADLVKAAAADGEQHNKVAVVIACIEGALLALCGLAFVVARRRAKSFTQQREHMLQ